MKWSQFFIPTTKETPADATVPSHQLMIRAGLIRQVSAGAYSYLPLGYRALRKVEAIVREEMNRAGGIELHMPAMHPIEWWEETGRVAAMGDVLIRLGGGDSDDWRSRTVLGPTHEEVITEHCRAFINSYKQLPITLYQIQTKFRGEARPKSGVLRTREFLMKDAYSFHMAKDGPGGLDETYQRMYDAYCAIFSRCGLPYVPVQAESGPIGGDASHEFMVPTDAGEDYLVQSEDGTYAANLERAEVAPLPDPKNGTNAAIAEVHTPGLRTIDEVSSFLKCSPAQMIKTIIYEADGEPLVALVRGDHEVNESKLARTAGVTRVTPAEPDLIKKVTGADVGFAGPVGLNVLSEPRPSGSDPEPQASACATPADSSASDTSSRTDKGATGGSPASAGSNKAGASTCPTALEQSNTARASTCPTLLPVRVIADQAVTVMYDAVTGANKTDHHLTGVNRDRDFTITESGDIRMAVEGDAATNGSPLIFKKCIEVGHVFKLGTKYSEAMQATCLNKDGKPKPFIMGCYGIGLNRIMAAAIEASHDDNGIIWPQSIAPFQVVICALDTRVEEVNTAAQQIHDDLESAGIDVLLDDRDARPGFKFNDADLIGFPVRIVVGKRGLADGVVEIHDRKTGETEKVSPSDVTDRIVAAMKS